ncbi:hypothetical protein BGZ81_007881 [Podila clonocystis]|nr:hypothetical protein BGZ81_007881 [Podila clonocystis]
MLNDWNKVATPTTWAEAVEPRGRLATRRQRQVATHYRNHRDIRSKQFPGSGVHTLRPMNVRFTTAFPPPSPRAFQTTPPAHSR